MWTRSRTSRGTSTGKETQSILAVFLRDINLVGHVDCLNGLRGGHAHGHRDSGDGQPQQGHVPHYDQGVQHSLTSQLARAAALQSVAVRRSTGNDVSGHYFRRYFFLFSFFSVVNFSHRRSARIKKLI